MAKNGFRLEGLFYLLILRTIKGIMYVTYVLSGYQLEKLQLTMLLQEAEFQVYDTNSPTWPSPVRRVMQPKGQRVLSTNKRKKKNPMN